MNIDFLNQLLNSHGISGDEDDIGCLYSNYLNSYCEISCDAIKNVYAILNKQSEKRIMIDAHIDEIGFQVSYIDECGFIYLRKTGGIDASCLIGAHVSIKCRTGERITGVIGKCPIHIQKPEERTRILDIDELWVDTGLEAAYIQKKVLIGDPISFLNNTIRLSEHRIASKAIDNRVGVFVMCETIKQLSQRKIDCGIYAVASTQEEVGLKGSKVSCANVKPSIAFCIDTGFATDVPNISKKQFGEVTLGGGVTINYHSDCDKELAIIAEHVAQTNKISFQRTANPIASGGTNAASIQIAEGGVRTLLLTIPCRYMHTQVEMCDLRDVESTIKLLVETICYINKEHIR